MGDPLGHRVSMSLLTKWWASPTLIAACWRVFWSQKSILITAPTTSSSGWVVQATNRPPLLTHWLSNSITQSLVHSLVIEPQLNYLHQCSTFNPMGKAREGNQAAARWSCTTREGRAPVAVDGARLKAAGFVRPVFYYCRRCNRHRPLSLTQRMNAPRRPVNCCSATFLQRKSCRSSQFVYCLMNYNSSGLLLGLCRRSSAIPAGFN